MAMGDDRTERHCPRKRVLRHRFEGALQRAACQLSQSAGHHVHAIEEERKPGIRVNCVSPGVILTDMVANVAPEVLAELAQEAPPRKNGLYFLSVFGKVRPYRTNYTISQKTERVKAHFPEFRSC